jgi:hypothetical protein
METNQFTCIVGTIPFNMGLQHSSPTEEQATGLVDNTSLCTAYLLALTIPSATTGTQASMSMYNTTQNQKTPRDAKLPSMHAIPDHEKHNTNGEKKPT